MRFNPETWCHEDKRCPEVGCRLLTVYFSVYAVYDIKAVETWTTLKCISLYLYQQNYTFICSNSCNRNRYIFSKCFSMFSPQLCLSLHLDGCGNDFCVSVFWSCPGHLTRGNGIVSGHSCLWCDNWIRISRWSNQLADLHWRFFVRRGKNA